MSDMQPYMTMNLKAENKSTLLNILQSIDVKGLLLNGNLKTEDTEAYAMAHLLSSIAEKDSLLTFPLELIHRKKPLDKPDFLLTMNGKNVGIEHTDARPDNETKKDVLRRTEGSGPSAYFIKHIEPDEPKRPTKRLREEIEANDSGTGWGNQDNTDQRWSDVILYFIDKKEKKLKAPDFSRYEEDWLVIRDAWHFPSVNQPNAIKHLFSHIKTRNIKLEFDRIFIISYSDRGPVCEISESGFHLHPRNDLWS